MPRTSDKKLLGCVLEVDMKCMLCPRQCGADREAGEMGVCGVGDRFRVARAAPHVWEEPSISGSRGSGTVFFSGCPLGCVFCQNSALSREGYGAEVDDGELERIILSLAESGVHNINLVTPTHFTHRLIPLLDRLKPRLSIPVVYNCGGYERVETLRALEGLVDVYLPDFKYASSSLARSYSAAPDYPEVAAAALVEMHRQRGAVRFDGEGMMVSGVMVRHLVLPGERRDSEAVLRRIAELVPVEDIRLSLMRQYTPDFVDGEKYPRLARRLTSFEYQSVVRVADELGFDGYTQDKSSAEAAYTPDFDLTGIQ